MTLLQSTYIPDSPRDLLLTLQFRLFSYHLGSVYLFGVFENLESRGSSEVTEMHGMYCLQGLIYWPTAVNLEDRVSALVELVCQWVELPGWLPGTLGTEQAARVLLIQSIFFKGSRPSDDLSSTVFSLCSFCSCK